MSRPPRDWENYWPEWADRVIDWLYSGRSLLSFTEIPGSPARRTVYDLADNNQKFGAQFARAKVAGAGVLIDRSEQIADDATPANVQVAKLQVDVCYRRAAALAPLTYGTKVMVGGDESAPPIRVSAVQAATEIAALLRLAEERKKAEEDGDA